MKILVAVLLLIAPQAYAEQVFRIEVGENYKSYSKSDLQRRVWDLERAVWQLQQRVFQLEAKPNFPTPVPVPVPTPAPAPVDSWLCKIVAMGNTYTGIGGTKAVASHRALESCKAGNNGDGFFCKNVTCEQ